MHRAAPTPAGYRTGFEIEPHDFTISADGLRCHALTGFSLIHVNRQLRRESLSLVFQNATVCVEVKIPRYGGLSKVAASVPGVLHALSVSSLLCELAQKVTVVFHPESAYLRGPLVEIEGDVVFFIRKFPGLSLLTGLAVCVLGPVYALAGMVKWAHRISPFQERHANLQSLVDFIASEFKSCHFLKIVLYLDDLYSQGLNIILGLFKAPCSSIELEERWVQWHWPPMRHVVIQNYDDNYRTFAGAAIEEAGHRLRFSVLPSSDEFQIEESDDGDVRGSKIVGKRQRLWLENYEV